MLSDLQPIATAPRGGEQILLYAPDQFAPDQGLFGVGVWVPRAYSGEKSRWVWPYDAKPTHWVYLPPVPAGRRN